METDTVATLQIWQWNKQILKGTEHSGLATGLSFERNPKLESSRKRGTCPVFVCPNYIELVTSRMQGVLPEPLINKKTHRSVLSQIKTMGSVLQIIENVWLSEDIPQIVVQSYFLECSDRVTVLIRIITDDALHISSLIYARLVFLS